MLGRMCNEHRRKCGRAWLGADFKPVSRVLIAGGSKGIGREMALAFAGAGAGLGLRPRAGLDALRADAQAQGVGLHAFAADRGQPDQAWLQAAADTLGGIDVLVNNATGYGMADDEDGWYASLT